MMAVIPGTPSAVVPVVSAWYSKINWTQILSVGAMIATMAGIAVPAGFQEAVLGAIIAVQAVVTIVLKTYFTSTVAPTSLK